MLYAWIHFVYIPWYVIFGFHGHGQAKTLLKLLFLNELVAFWGSASQGIQQIVGKKMSGVGDTTTADFILVIVQFLFL